jgi:hypothetical protein
MSGKVSPPGLMAVGIKVIGWTEVLGASWSCSTMMWVLTHTPGLRIPWAFLLCALGAFAFVGVAGVLILQGTQLGEILTITAQLLQLAQVVAGPIAFRFAAGPQCLLIWSGKFGFFLGVSSSINVWRSQLDPAFEVVLNLVPLAFLLLLICTPLQTISNPRPDADPTT